MTGDSGSTTSEFGKDKNFYKIIFQRITNTKDLMTEKSVKDEGLLNPKTKGDVRNGNIYITKNEQDVESLAIALLELFVDNNSDNREVLLETDQLLKQYYDHLKAYFKKIKNNQSIKNLADIR